MPSADCYPCGAPLQVLVQLGTHIQIAESRIDEVRLLEGLEEGRQRRKAEGSVGAGYGQRDAVWAELVDQSHGASEREGEVGPRGRRVEAADIAAGGDQLRELLQLGDQSDVVANQLFERVHGVCRKREGKGRVWRAESGGDVIQKSHTYTLLAIGSCK